MKIHYRNLHQPTNLPWQKAFAKYGDLSLGSITSGGFPDHIDHLHLGGSCKGPHSLTPNPITVDEIKAVQASTRCSISSFFGDAWPDRFQFHHALLSAGIPKLKVYSASLFDTPMWHPDVTWLPHPTDEDIFQLVEHTKNTTLLFSGHLTPYRKQVLSYLSNAGIHVDVTGTGGNISPKFGKDLVELSKHYTISIGMVYDTTLPTARYFSSRLPNALAMGLIYIETYFDLTGVFAPDELIQWHTLPDLVSKIRYYQTHLDQGFRVTRKGRNKVLSNWTFTKSVKRFITEGGY